MHHHPHDHSPLSLLPQPATASGQSSSSPSHNNSSESVDSVLYDPSYNDLQLLVTVTSKVAGQNGGTDPSQSSSEHQPDSGLGGVDEDVNCDDEYDDGPPSTSPQLSSIDGSLRGVEEGSGSHGNGCASDDADSILFESKSDRMKIEHDLAREEDHERDADAVKYYRRTRSKSSATVDSDDGNRSSSSFRSLSTTNSPFFGRKHLFSPNGSINWDSDGDWIQLYDKMVRISANTTPTHHAQSRSKSFINSAASDSSSTSTTAKLCGCVLRRMAHPQSAYNYNVQQSIYASPLHLRKGKHGLESIDRWRRSGCFFIQLFSTTISIDRSVGSM